MQSYHTYTYTNVRVSMVSLEASHSTRSRRHTREFSGFSWNEQCLQHPVAYCESLYAQRQCNGRHEPSAFQRSYAKVSTV